MASCRPDPQTGCWVWTGKRDRGGYARINIWRDGRTQTFRAHRLVAEIVARRPLDRVEETVEHDCFNKPCVNPAHFRLCSLGDNTHDRRARELGRESFAAMFPLVIEDEENWMPRGVVTHPSEPIPF